MSSRLLTAGELAAYLRLSRKTIYNLVSQGRIPFLKAAGALRFSLEQINLWLERKNGCKSTKTEPRTAGEAP